MKKIELNNNEQRPVQTVGELKGIIEPFVGKIKISPVRVYYIFDGVRPARLEIKQAAPEE